MSTEQFILVCMGCYSSACAYIDRICEAFDIDDLTEDEVIACVETDHYRRNVGNALIAQCFEKIIYKAQQEYPERAEILERFTYYCEDYASSIQFNGVTVNNWDELEREIENFFKFRKTA